MTFPMNKLNGRIVTPNEPQNEPQNEHQNEPQKRALTIESLIVENESISINAIAERLNAARITVRRDLKKLGYAWDRKMVVGFENCGLDHRSIKDYI